MVFKTGIFIVDDVRFYILALVIEQEEAFIYVDVEFVAVMFIDLKVDEKVSPLTVVTASIESTIKLVTFNDASFAL